MNDTIRTVVPLMTALVVKPGLDAPPEQINAAAADLMALMTSASHKVLKVLVQDDPKCLATINRILALLVAKIWQTTDIDADSADKIAQIFIAVIDGIDIDLDQAFDQDKNNIAIGIDTVGQLAQCLPPIIELREIDPEKAGRGKLLLGTKPYEQNMAFLQKKIAEITDQLTQKMMVKDADAERNIAQGVSDLLAVILKTQFDLLTQRVKATVTTDDQKKFLEEKNRYPEGMLIEKSLEHLDGILKICFPGTREG